MKKIFFASWFVLLVMCVWMLTGIHFKTLGRKFMYPQIQNGLLMTGLYGDTKVDFFAEFCPAVTYRADAALDEAEIVAYGDSYFNTHIGDLYAGDLIQNATGKKVHTPETKETDPLEFLKEKNYSANKNIRILLLESVEDFSMVKVDGAQKHRFTPDNFFAKLTNAMRWRRVAVNAWLKENLIILNNDNKDIQYFFENNIVSYHMAKFIANFRFAYLEEMDPIVGAYSRDPKMIFRKSSVTFNKRAKTEKEIGDLVSFVTRVSKELKEKYNIHVIYTLIPSKYTVYRDHEKYTYTYDNFVPRVNRRLKENGVQVIDIYSKYQEYRATDDSQLLYYVADSHWTPLGKNIFVREVVKALNEFDRQQNGNEKKS